MKYALIAIAALSLTSCQKKYCWQCKLENSQKEIVLSRNLTRSSSYSSEIKMICDQTEKQINSQEEQYNKEYATGEGDIRYEFINKMTCEKKD